ncbi:hypothetical protein P691DRAFT_686489, partial [Macrolepiota fuliginosa MF-IS2]
YWAAGVNDVLTVDQHDKWKHYRLALHCRLDPFSGRMHWMKVWHNNNNPKLIAGYYLDFVEEIRGIPMITQSDPGSENYRLTNAHTALRQIHDPSLQGMLQHCWMCQKKNVMPEIAWSQMQARFAPNYEDLLEEGVRKEWYDVNNDLDKLLFRWLFIPWLQRKINYYISLVNNKRKRKDKNKILPHGVPEDIFWELEQYRACDFKVAVDLEVVKQVQDIYAPPGDPVFQLVLPDFNCLVKTLYASMGHPEVDMDSVWDIFCGLQFHLDHVDKVVAQIEAWGSVKVSIEEGRDANNELGTDLQDQGYLHINSQGDFFIDGAYVMHSRPHSIP